jgi:outer membrane protein TolC
LIEPSQKLLPEPQQYNLQESWKKGLAMRPDLLQLRVDLERRDIMLRYQRNQLYPQLDLVGSYGRSGLATTLSPSLADINDERLPAYSYGAVLSFPLGNRTASNTARATKAAKEQAVLQYKKLEQNVLVQIDDSVKLAQSDFERVDATREARIYAEAALDAEQKKLENGKSTSFLVLQAQRDLTASRSAEIRALADYNKALSQLALNEGTTLERNKLSVVIK